MEESADQPHFLDYYNENTNICPATALKVYLERTRGVERPNDKVFLSSKAPYQELAKDTIATDTMSTMKEAGVDIARYKSHSTRHAAATKAIESGATIDEVMARGGWKSRHVFQEFYNCAVSN